MYLEDDIPVGFVHQYETGSCGVYALAHLMNLLGNPSFIEDATLYTNYRSIKDSFYKHFSIRQTIFNPKGTIRKIISGYGVREKGILGAIRKIGYQPVPFETLSENEAQSFLSENFTLFNPIILHVNYSKEENEDGHWFVCGGIYKNKYIIIDSDEYGSILTLYSWTDLYRRCTWFNQAGKHFRFIAIAVNSLNGINLIPKLGELLGTLQKNQILQYWWGYYLSNLVEVFQLKDTEIKEPIHSKDFFNKYSDTLRANISYWLNDIELAALDRELKNYCTVATAYNMSFERTKLEEVLIGFTSALIWTLTEYE